MQEKAEYESLCDYNDNEGFNMVCIAYFYRNFFKQLLKRDGGGLWEYKTLLLVK